MPTLLIQTNQPADEMAVNELLDSASAQVAEALGKSEDYMQVSLSAGCGMRFGGTDAATAFVELRALGLPRAKQADLSALICGLLGKSLGIEADRIYINFIDFDRPDWGWNGKTFG